MLNQVEATDAALEFLEEIKKDYGNLIFHQSGGCCDGSAPMCFQKDDFLADLTSSAALLRSPDKNLSSARAGMRSRSKVIVFCRVGLVRNGARNSTP